MAFATIHTMYGVVVSVAVFDDGESALKEATRLMLADPAQSYRKESWRDALKAKPGTIYWVYANEKCSIAVRPTEEDVISQSYMMTLIENVAAVSAEFHKSDQYRKFYNENGDALSGFPGIWNYTAEAGRAFTVAESEMNVEWDGEWIESIDTFAAELIESLVLPWPELVALAKKVIQQEIDDQAELLEADDTDGETPKVQSEPMGEVHPEPERHSVDGESDSQP